MHPHSTITLSILYDFYLCKTEFVGVTWPQKFIYSPLLGLRNTLWPGSDWGGVQADVCCIECLIRAGCTPHHAGAVDHGWTRSRLARGGIPLFNGCKLMAVDSLWWRCGDDVRGLYVHVWECTCTLCAGQRSLSEQLFIKGFHGNVLPNIAAGGRQNEVKPHLLQPCRAEYWLTGTFQVFGTKKVLMERHVKGLVVCLLRSETLLRWEHFLPLKVQVCFQSVVYTDGAALLCTQYSWIAVKHVRLFYIKRKMCWVHLQRRSVVV